MDGKTIQCNPNPSQHVPVYIQQFSSYTMLKSMRKSKSRYFYHIFVSRGDAPGAITLNVVWMEREFDAYKLSRSMYCTHLSSAVSQLFKPQVQKIARFHVPQPTFLFPLETPLRVSRNMLHGWKGNAMLVKLLAAGTYPGASTPYKRWSKCTREKVGGGERFCRNLGGKCINY